MALVTCDRRNMMYRRTKLMMRRIRATRAPIYIRQHTSAPDWWCAEYAQRARLQFNSTVIKALLRLYQDSFKALLRLYESCMKALAARSMQALLRQYQSNGGRDYWRPIRRCWSPLFWTLLRLYSGTGAGCAAATGEVTDAWFEDVVVGDDVYGLWRKRKQCYNLPSLV